MAFDTGNSNHGALSTLGVSITVAANSNRLLAVSIPYRSGTITGVSSNVDGALTQAVARFDASTECGVEIWRLVAPSTGAHTITVSRSGALWTAAYAASLYSIDQGSPVNDTDSAVATSLSAFTTVTDLCDIVDGASGNANQADVTMTAMTGRVERMHVDPAAADDFAGASTIIAATPAGSKAMEWAGTIGAVVVAAVAFTPAAAAGVKLATRGHIIVPYYR